MEPDVTEPCRDPHPLGTPTALRRLYELFELAGKLEADLVQQNGQLT